MLSLISLVAGTPIIAPPAPGGLTLVTNVRDLSKNQVGCPYAHRVWLTLELKGLQYTRVEIDLNQKPQWLLDVSPLGRVPALLL